jgi:NAD(P)-dependent dehydrogenase (short-subunit alcohol dehydrogenase family)
MTRICFSGSPWDAMTDPLEVVLVTGGARRVGRALVLELAAPHRCMVIHYRHSAAAAAELVELIRSRGLQAHAIPADLSDEAACEGLVPAVLERVGRLDAVVNNASLFEYDNIDSFSVASMEAHWRANTAPAIVLARALARHAARRGGTACLVNVLDQKLWNPDPDYLSYTLSKAALQCSTVLLAQALAPQVRVCGVAPGVTLPSGSMTDADFAQAHRQTVLQRSSTPQDVARAVRFLIESPAITGSTVLVDGGQHLTPRGRDLQFLPATQPFDGP